MFIFRVRFLQFRMVVVVRRGREMYLWIYPGRERICIFKSLPYPKSHPKSQIFWGGEDFDALGIKFSPPFREIITSCFIRFSQTTSCISYISDAHDVVLTVLWTLEKCSSIFFNILTARTWNYSWTYESYLNHLNL